MPRLFFAIETPPEIKRELAQVQEKIAVLLGDVKGVKRENLAQSHCTIRFLDEIAAEKIDAIVHSVREQLLKTNVTPLALSIGELGVFGGWNKARVLWAGLEPKTPLMHLHDALDSTLGRAGIEPEDRPFHPHLTLFRFKTPHRFSERIRDEVVELGSGLSGGGLTSELLLFQSVLSSNGAIHTPIEKFPLVAR